MMERVGSGSTVVCSGGSSSSRLPQPSSTTSERVDSKRPAGFDTAPRPLRAAGRIGLGMDKMLLDIKPGWKRQVLWSKEAEALSTRQAKGVTFAWLATSSAEIPACARAL